MDKPGEIVNGQDMDELRQQFTHHPPHADQVRRYERIRDAAHGFAKEIVECCPPSADRTVAIRKIREAVMVANASIAITERREQPEAVGSSR